MNGNATCGHSNESKYDENLIKLCESKHMQTEHLNAEMASSQQKSAYRKFKISCYFNKVPNLDQNTKNKLWSSFPHSIARDLNHNFHQQKASEKWNCLFVWADSAKVNTGQSWRWDMSLLCHSPYLFRVLSCFFHFSELNFLKCYSIYSSYYENICSPSLYLQICSPWESESLTKKKFNSNSTKVSWRKICYFQLHYHTIGSDKISLIKSVLR